MNKQQLIEAIANEVDVTKATAAACLDAFINTVTKVLKKKGDVRLVGFGTFTTAKRKATTGRNRGNQCGGNSLYGNSGGDRIIDSTEGY